MSAAAMRAADTNVLVRLVLRDDAAQFAAATAALKEGLWISHIILAEAVWVLSAVYKLPRVALQETLAMLLQYDSITIQEAQTVTVALELFVAHPKTDFTDCLAVAVARQAGHTPVLTFDKPLAKLAGAELLR